MVGNDGVNWVDRLGLSSASYELLDITGGQDQENPRTFDPNEVIADIVVMTFIDTSDCCESYSLSGESTGCEGDVKVTFGFFYFPRTNHAQNTLGEGPGIDGVQAQMGITQKPEIHMDNDGSDGSGSFEPNPYPLEWHGDIDSKTRRRKAIGSVMFFMKDYKIPCSGGTLQREFFITTGMGARRPWKKGRRGTFGMVGLTGSMFVGIGNCGEVVVDQAFMNLSRRGDHGIFNDHLREVDKDLK